MLLKVNLAYPLVFSKHIQVIAKNPHRIVINIIFAVNLLINNVLVVVTVRELKARHCLLAWSLAGWLALLAGWLAGLLALLAGLLAGWLAGLLALLACWFACGYPSGCPCLTRIRRPNQFFGLLIWIRTNVPKHIMFSTSIFL